MMGRLSGLRRFWRRFSWISSKRFDRLSLREDFDELAWGKCNRFGYFDCFDLQLRRWSMGTGERDVRFDQTVKCESCSPAGEFTSFVWTHKKCRFKSRLPKSVALNPSPQPLPPDLENDPQLQQSALRSGWLAFGEAPSSHSPLPLHFPHCLFLLWAELRNFPKSDPSNFRTWRFGHLAERKDQSIR